MKKAGTRVLFIVLGLALSTPAVAHAGSLSAERTTASNPARTMKAYLKNQKKQQKKTLKAQEKAQKKMQKLRKANS